MYTGIGGNLSLAQEEHKKYQSYVYESFPFVEPTDDQRTAIEQAVQAYYARIDNLLTLPQYDNLRAVLVDNPAVLRAAKDNITRAVYPLYGLQAEETYSVEQIENAELQRDPLVD